MRRVWGDHFFWFWLSLVALILHFFWALDTMNGMNFSRCGAILVVSGIAVTARHWLRKSISQRIKETKIIDGGSFAPSLAEIEEERQTTIDFKCAELYGPLLALFGSLVWAYGDIAFHFFYPV